jgi:lysyl-tRNA synthetase class 2
MSGFDFKKWLASRRAPEFRARMEKRAAVMGEVRRFFRDCGFLECETPIMVQLPGMEPNLSPMRTSVRPQDGTPREAWLITSPEYSLKKLLAAGYGPIFEITRAFRDGEPWSGAHNPEFTMLEWYRPQADYRALMTDTEEMVAAVATAVTGSPRVTHRGRTLDVAPGWERLTVAEAMERHAGIDLARGIDDPEWFAAEVRACGLDVPAGESFDDTFFRIFLRDVEPKLGLERPVFLYDYPRSMASLARLKADDPRFAERVEAYAGGLELANGFSELTDAAEQRRRLTSEREERARLGRQDFALDEAFLAAVGQMPPSAGIAFGLDRLVMLLTDAPSIREVLFFPAETFWSQTEP